MKTIIRADQFKTRTWKNGQGITAEIAISPEGADFTHENFKWRLSSAQITAANSFSIFPGYDRFLMVLKGEGLLLNDKKLRTYEVYKFPGEEKIECSLLAGAVEDLGIIFDRKKCECEMRILKFDKKDVLEFKEGVHFLKPLSFDIVFDGMLLEGGAFLKIQGLESCEIEASDFPAQVLIVSCSA